MGINIFHSAISCRLTSFLRGITVTAHSNMFRDKPMLGVPRLTRRELIVTLGSLFVTPNTVMAKPAGFAVTGTLTATELERQEGYATIGNELMIATHPKSPVYGHLTDLIGYEVRLSLDPQ